METIDVVRIHKLELQRFSDWVYVRMSDVLDGESFFVPRKEFDARCAKNKKNPYLWLTKNVEKYYELRHYMVTESYMKDYLEGGCYLEPDWDNMYEKNTLSKMPEGEERIVFVGIIEDGYLRRGGKRILRAHYFDNIHQKGYPGYHSPDEIVRILTKHPKITRAWKKEVPYYNQDSCGNWEVCFLYVPTPQEFRQWFAEADKKKKYMSNFELWREIQKSLGIKKFERQEGD